MNIHIQGIGGTFMSGVALLAQALGHQVRGSDRALYPPMGDQITAAGIPVELNYTTPLDASWVDQVIVGNALSRGVPQVEDMLNQGISMDSGPGWLVRHVLPGRRVLAVSGTHGKTTTSSLLVWILRSAGLDPGYLIGGMPGFSDVSAHLGTSPWFVIEADEYDSAFFDRRAKCLQLHPYGMIVNNLEFDHADIYNNLTEIQCVFKDWIKCLPREGCLICPAEHPHLVEIAEVGQLLSQVESIHTKNGWHIEAQSEDFKTAAWCFNDTVLGVFSGDWLCPHLGDNALAAAVMAHRCVGLEPSEITQALNHFPGVKRRMECIGQRDQSVLYDDFAHHPTAIAQTLATMGKRHPHQPILVCLELGSYTLKQSFQVEALANALGTAHQIYIMKPESGTLGFESQSLNDLMPDQIQWFESPQLLLDAVQVAVRSNTVVLTLSSRAFEGVRQPLFDWWRSVVMAS